MTSIDRSKEHGRIRTSSLAVSRKCIAFSFLEQLREQDSSLCDVSHDPKQVERTSISCRSCSCVCQRWRQHSVCFVPFSSIHDYHENIEFIQTTQRHFNNLPKCQHETHRRERTFAAGQRSCIFVHLIASWRYLLRTKNVRVEPCSITGNE
jgi:hypothetical protein